MQTPDRHISDRHIPGRGIPDRHIPGRGIPDRGMDAEQDAELRAIAVPAELVDRLRRTVLADDDGLDAAIREVPVPQRLAGRLRRAVLTDDEGLDAVIREVPLPVGLTPRLRRSILTTDDGLDALIGDLPAPAALAGRLRRVPRGRIRWERLTQWVTALSVMFAIGLSYSGAMLGFLVTTYHGPDDVQREALAASASIELSDPVEQEVQLELGSILADQRYRPEGEGPQWRLPVPQFELDPFERPGLTSLAEVGALFSGPDPVGWQDISRFGWNRHDRHLILSPPDPTDEQPDLEQVPGIIPRGIDPPPGTNMAEYLRTRIQPPVAPVADSGDRTGLVPLGVDSSSYELTQRYLESGKLPPAEAIRTEEFLAAVDYDFPRPKDGALELFTASAASSKEGEGVCVLQIGVQGRDFADENRRPAHLVLAIDTSRSMRWGGRLEMIRKALGKVVRQLGPEDRISLVPFSEDAYLLIENAGREHADQLLAAVELLSVASSTNVGAGLRQAYAAAPYRVGEGEAVSRVVLLTDGRVELDGGTAGLIRQRLANAAEEDIRLDVIDLGQETESDPQLAGFARSGGGNVYRATSAEEIRWTLLEIITGRSQLVCTDARLRVTFNPETVVAYRLLGHEMTPMAGLMPSHPEADFHVGQSATALYEVWLKTGISSHGNVVATAELTWQEPGSDEIHRLTRTVGQKQFAAKFIDAPLSLQEAVVVAKAAEVLRRSKYARMHSISEVLQLAKSLDSRLLQRPTFVEFLSLVEKAAGPR